MTVTARSRQAPGAKKMRGLIADAMLGSLARKMRIFGFDTTYLKDVEDSELLKEARKEERLVLTSDRGLWSRALRAGIPVILVNGEDDRERLGSFVRQVRSLPAKLLRRESRCALCNGTLRKVDRERLSGLFPEAILRRHRLYYRCRRCAKVYWKGGHWLRLRRLSNLLEERKRI